VSSKLEEAISALKLFCGLTITEHVDKLFKIFIIQKKVGKLAFQKDWHLKKMHFNKENKTLQILVTSKEDGGQRSTQSPGQKWCDHFERILFCAMLSV